VARPRTITDEHLLGAVSIVVNQVGPGFTIADVATQAGVSVGTVAQRFGSKQGLLKALSRNAIHRIEGQVRAAAEQARTPLAGVRAAILAVYGDLDDPATAVNNLGQLAKDLMDPELRALLGEFYAVLEGQLRGLLRAAAGELPGAPPQARAARLLVSLANGTAIDWSIRPKGRLIERLRQDIDAVLDGWSRNG
jgi:AcrR family transcriptional regulator